MKPLQRVAKERDPRRLSCEILDRLEDGRARASQELARLGDRLADERDLRLATELVYGTLRRRAEIDHFLESLSGKPLSRIEAALLSPLRIGLHQILHLDRIPVSAAVDESVRLATARAGRRAGGFVNALLRKACRERQTLQLPPEGLDPIGSLTLRHSIPAWMISRWWTLLGEEETRSLLACLSRPAPLTLWVHPERADPAQLVMDLASEGVRVEPSPLLPGAFRIIEGHPQRTGPFRRGCCYVQDEASQAISLLMGARRDEFLVDLCSAPGGKALSLACRVGPMGRIVAFDRLLPRLRTLVSNRNRLGLPNILPVAADLSRPAPLLRPFAGVLLDAPCTGTGILRRQPEIRWRRSPSDLTGLTERQSDLLEATACLVEQGGRLVYSVCSLEPEEGEERVQAFLSRHREYQLADAKEFLPSPINRAVTGEGYFRTWPHRHDCDGFFAAILRRRMS